MRSRKLRPDAPDVPDEWTPAPGALESGANWDGLLADDRVEVPERVANFTATECRWTDADLSGVRFTGLRCRDMQFVHCDLSGALLEDAVLTRVTLTNCRLVGTVLNGAELADVHISDCRADLASLRMARAQFLLVENTSLHAADFFGFIGTNCAILGCDLAEANFFDAELAGLNLHGSTVDDIRGALALRGSRIGVDQVIPLGAALLSEVDIQVSEHSDDRPLQIAHPGRSSKS